MYSLIIIDDEPKIAEGMAQLFPWNNIGFQVVRSFTSAAEALEYMDENPVDVVLSDIQMPDMTGLELCEKLLGREKTQVVLFSSYQNYEYFRSAIQMGVADYLMVDGFKAFLDAEQVISMELLSRSLSFYCCVLLCGIAVLIMTSRGKRSRFHHTKQGTQYYNNQHF